MILYHNPRCSTSRKALALLEEADADIEIVDYMKNQLSPRKLKAILNKLKMKPFDLIRKKEAIFKTEWKGKSLTDEEWIQVMIDEPKLMERPILVNGRKARVGRPPEEILTIL